MPLFNTTKKSYNFHRFEGGAPEVVIPYSSVVLLASSVQDVYLYLAGRWKRGSGQTLKRIISNLLDMKHSKEVLDMMIQMLNTPRIKCQVSNDVF